MLCPLIGPDAYSPEWYADRPHHLFASEMASALGVPDAARTPLEIYMEKLGLVEPFSGNQYTSRGRRIEAFMPEEYELATGRKVETGIPTYYHATHRFIGATIDARCVSDRLYLVEFKSCHYRRAKQLGEEHSDQIFADWQVQAQTQMLVHGAHCCDVFTMLDLHTFKLFTVERNEALQEQIIDGAAALWDRIQRRDPPPPDFPHFSTGDLLKQLYPVEGIGSVQLSQTIASKWAKLVALRQRHHDMEDEMDALKNEVLHAIGDAAVGKLPLGQKEIVRTVVPESRYTETDALVIQQKIGKVKRKAYSKLIERKVL